MKLVETEPLAQDLEKGLGEVHWLMKSIYPWLRLRMSVCAITSIAVSERLREQGHDVELFVSQPKLDIDPTMRHVIPVVHQDGTDTVIDSTYSQFLEYAGLHSGYVMLGGKDSYPTEKIAAFELGRSEEIVTRLSLVSRQVMDHYEPIDDIPYPVIEFTHLNDEEIEANLAEIWNPNNFSEFIPTDETAQVGKKLASFILPQHVNLVA